MSEVRPLNEQNRDNDRQNPNNKRRRRRRRRNSSNNQEGGNNGGMQLQHTNHAGAGGGEGGGRGRRRRRRRSGGEHSGGNQRSVRLDPYELFAAFHLGLAPNGRYRKQGVRDVARRFNCGQRDVQDALTILCMDRVSLRKMRFEPEWAELDIKVAPEGIDRGEVAKTLYQEFLECGRKAGLFEDEPSYPPLPSEEPEEHFEELEESEEPEASEAQVELEAKDHLGFDEDDDNFNDDDEELI